MEKLAVRASANLINWLGLAQYLPQCVDHGSPHRWVEVDEDGSRDVFAAAGFGKEGFEGTCAFGSF